MKAITFMISLLVVINLYGGNSRNGYQLPTGPGAIRLFIVYAELINDPNDRGDLLGWHTAQMPPFANDIVDSSFTTAANIHGNITKYFYEASLGKLKVLGNYYPSVVQFDYNSFPSNNKYNVDSVIKKFTTYFNAIPGSQFQVSGGRYFPSDFDKWTLQPDCNVHLNNSNGFIDVFAVIWRNNSKYISGRNGGNLWLGQQFLTTKIKGKDIDVFTMMCDENDLYGTLKHELGHGFIGDNNFHCAPTNSGEGMFIEDYSGYCMLSGNGRNLDGYNGWDRYRLGWKNQQQQYIISARDVYNQEKKGDLIYGENIGDSSIYILRDFATTNDAVRIKLPFVKSLNTSARDQWIWIENHQLDPSKIEFDPYKHGVNSPMFKIPRGIRLNIQIGNEDTSRFDNSRTNFISPLSRFGKFDFSYQSNIQLADGQLGYLAKTDTSFSNPFTGMGFNKHPVDINSDNVLQDGEYVLPGKIEYNGAVLSANNFGYFNYPVFGSVFDAFYPGDKIAITSNPTTATWLTHKRVGDSPLPLTYDTDDNRFIYLNGLNIHVLEQRSNGDIKISVRWNDFKVSNNVRWCGPIVLNEKIYLKANKTIIFDQGLSPTNRSNPMAFNGQMVFANPTVFTAKNGSLFKLEANSNVVVKNNSAMIFEPGSKLEINSGAKLSIKSGSTLQIKSGDTLIIKGNGQINVESGGYICIESGATIILQDATSFINLQTGFISGTNPSVIPSSTCVSAASATKTGNGQINDYNTDLYIQNQTISSGKYYAGKNIYVAGSGGAVLINNNASVKFNAAQYVFFQNGFEVSTGASFEVVKQ